MSRSLYICLICFKRNIHVVFKRVYRRKCECLIYNLYFIEMAPLACMIIRLIITLIINVNINYNHGDESRKKNPPQEQHQQRTVKTNIYLAFFFLKDRMSQSHKQ